MIKQTITYEDFDGNKVTEDHYFHLSKSELLEMLDGEDDIVSRLQAVGASNNGALIMRTFKEFIAAAYGQRVDNQPTKFHKSEKITEEFLGSPAFDELLTRIVTSADFAATFVNGLLPKGLEEMAASVEAAQVAAVAQTVELPQPAQTVYSDQSSGLTKARNRQGTLHAWAFREPTNKEMAAMTPEELRDVYTRKASGWKPPSTAA